jgi:hypothetical protein
MRANSWGYRSFTAVAWADLSFVYIPTHCSVTATASAESKSTLPLSSTNLTPALAPDGLDDLEAEVVAAAQRVADALRRLGKLAGRVDELGVGDRGRDLRLLEPVGPVVEHVRQDRVRHVEDRLGGFRPHRLDHAREVVGLLGPLLEELVDRLEDAVVEVVLDVRLHRAGHVGRRARRVGDDHLLAHLHDRVGGVQLDGHELLGLVERLDRVHDHLLVVRVVGPGPVADLDLSADGWRRGLGRRETRPRGHGAAGREAGRTDGAKRLTARDRLVFHGAPPLVAGVVSVTVGHGLKVNPSRPRRPGRS